MQKFKSCKLLKYVVKSASSFNVFYLGSSLGLLQGHEYFYPHCHILKSIKVVSYEKILHYLNLHICKTIVRMLK